MTDHLNSSTPKPSPLLIVEDSDEDFEVFRRCAKRLPIKIPLFRCGNGEEAMAFLCRTGDYVHLQPVPLPSLIVIDLNLPLIDGRELLKRIKQDKHFKFIPVVVFTTSDNPKDIEECYQNGAHSYMVKPIDFSRLKQDVDSILNHWIEVSITQV